MKRTTITKINIIIIIIAILYLFNIKPDGQIHSDSTRNIDRGNNDHLIPVYPPGTSPFGHFGTIIGL